MIPDPTDEIREIRDRLAAKCNYDLDRIVEETRMHQRESGRSYNCGLVTEGGQNDEPTDPAKPGFGRMTEVS